MTNKSIIFSKKSVILFIFVILVFSFFCIITADTPANAFYKQFRDGPKNINPDISNSKDIFGTDLFTGAFTYTYSINLPPGTNGLTPSTDLVYNSEASN